MKKKFSLSSSISDMSLNKRIKTIQLLDYCLMHSWTKFPVLAINLAFTWFFVLMGRISGFFDIVTLVIFPFLLIIGEFALVFFATFAEICAEMIADTLFPRYTAFPQSLLVRREAPKPAAEPASKPAAAPTPAAAPAPNGPKTPPTLNPGVKIDLSERLKKLQNEENQN